MTKTIAAKGILTVTGTAHIQNQSTSFIYYSEATTEPDGSNGYGYKLAPNENLKYIPLDANNKCYLYNPTSIPAEVKI